MFFSCLNGVVVALLIGFVTSAVILVIKNLVGALVPLGFSVSGVSVI